MLNTINIIPWPAEVEMLGSHLRLSRSMPIIVDPNIEEALPAAKFLSQQLGCPIGTTSAVSQIRFRRSATDHGAEGYALVIQSGGVMIEASAAAGWFYGVQTLLQLLPPSAAADSSKGSPRENEWDIAGVRIVDHPRFAWRGIMLDVVRHIMPVEGILRLLDSMAMHKLNTFHLHLTDDQGWRIESKRFPRLMEISAWRRGADGVLTTGQAAEESPREGRYGGFYSHADISRIVAHAAQRHIRVVPEIEMPGHAMAAIAAYPEFSCTGGPFEPATRTGIFHDVYCAGNDAVFEFLQSVIEEILPLFPSEYVHVGGDECPKDRWKSCPKCQARIRREGLKDEHELQSYFISRMQRFLSDRGKRLIGWDEILEGGLPASAAVMSWRGIEGGIAAAQAGHEAVMSPQTHCYLDYRQAADGEPLAIGQRVTTLETTYSYEPIPPELSIEQSRYIMGVQGNVWTEYMPNMQHVDYMIWPRGAAIAERGWSPAVTRDFDSFRRRVKANESRLAVLGSSFRPN